MNSEVLASLFGTVVGAGISLITTIWFQAVQKRAADRRQFKSYQMELSLTVSALNDCLIKHDALEKEVRTAEIDCGGRVALTPLTHDFPVDQIEVAAARLPNLIEDYDLILGIRMVRLMLQEAQEKLRMTKLVMGQLGVDQGPNSAADKSLGLLRKFLASRKLHGALTRTSLNFSDAFLRSQAQLENFDNDHSIWKYMTGRD